MKANQNGFTLIEIIVALVVGAILAAIIVQVMGTNLSRSAEPIFWVRNQLSLQEIMDSMIADYKYLWMTDSTPLETFKSRVESNYYGSYAATTKYIDFDASGQENITACSSDCKILKVTITNANQHLTALFTR